MATNDDDDDRRVTRQITARLDVRLLARIDRFIQSQVVPPNVTAVMETALRAFLDKHFAEDDPAPDPMDDPDLRKPIQPPLRPKSKPAAKPATPRRRS